MEPQTVPTEPSWQAAAALFLAVIVPFTLWCVYAFRMRQTTLRSVAGLAVAEVAALIAIAILAHY